MTDKSGPTIGVLWNGPRNPDKSIAPIDSVTSLTSPGLTIDNTKITVATIPEPVIESVQVLPDLRWYGGVLQQKYLIETR